MTGNLSSVALLFQISENLLKFKPFKTSRKLPIFSEKITLCMLNLCVYLICIRLPRNVRELKQAKFLSTRDAYRK